MSNADRTSPVETLTCAFPLPALRREVFGCVHRHDGEFLALGRFQLSVVAPDASELMGCVVECVEISDHIIASGQTFWYPHPRRSRISATRGRARSHSCVTLPPLLDHASGM